MKCIALWVGNLGGEKSALSAETPIDPIVSTEALDEILSLQLLVAWAGEEGDEPRRLGWWRTSMLDEFGGEDLFQRLLPNTWRWAVLEAARAAAKKVDAQHRQKSADPDQLTSLYHFGFALDEALDDRFAELKRNVPDPAEALPKLARIKDGWDQGAFLGWLADLAPANYAATPAGRRLKGSQPEDPVTAVKALAAAHANPGDTYPAPHFRRPD
jgi:hypothetical protein